MRRNKPSILARSNTVPVGAKNFRFASMLCFAAGLLVYSILYFAAVPMRQTYATLIFLPDVIFGYLYDSEVGPVILDRVPVWLTSFIWLCGAYAAGSLLLRLLRITEFTFIERIVLALSAGLQTVSLLTLLVGLCGGLSQPLLLRGLILLLIIIETYVIWQRNTNISTTIQYQRPHIALCMAFLFLFTCYLCAASIPPVEFDVREYHLQVPKEWFLAGKIDFLPHNVYGNMPLGAEMHALGCMKLWLGENAWWYGALAGKIITSLITPLTAVAIWLAACRWFTSQAGIFAALLYLTTPWLAHVSFHGLIDGVLAHYIFMTIYLLMLTKNPRVILLAGWMAGAALSCKYTALLFLFVPAIVYLSLQLWYVLQVSKTYSKPWVSLLLFFAATTASCGLWYAKNAVLSGNPVYPLAGSVLGGKTRTVEKIEQWEKAHCVPRTESGARYSLDQAIQSIIQVTLTSPWLSWLLWPCLMYGAWSYRQQYEIRVLLLYILFIFIAWWCLTHRIDRFWLVAMPYAAILAGLAYTKLAEQISQRWLCFVLAIPLTFNTLQIVAPITAADSSFWHVADPRWFFSLQVLRDEKMPSHRALEKIADKQGVLLVGDAQPFDLTMPVCYNTCFDSCLLESWTKDKSIEEIRLTFQQKQIQFILVDWQELARYRSPGNYGNSNYVQPELLALFGQQGLLERVDSATHEGQLQWEIYRIPSEINQPKEL
jgi:Dolichyl-phosphate-mannose-protein mannosyltransferase